MAYPCPDCDAPQAVTALDVRGEIFLHPCLSCGWLPAAAPRPSVLRANAPCPTRGCDGSVGEIYQYDERALRAVRREHCPQCYGGGAGAALSAPPSHRAAVR
ncbi:MULTISPECIES: hypothetical protein [Streptomyces]|uniref:Uncharacterized protein n=2 Tax=Streptomyces TaxID=1883 RepID=A0A1I6T5P1_9ACTN|nr:MULTISPECIES: hypothetical protein [Streptomyces]QKV69659.1 hypothetical protein HUT13_13360 [Streptomyces harbinensis]SFS84561.1 hypothetical protein SAMN05444716_104422 [Streptomyces harbinensis]